MAKFVCLFVCFYHKNPIGTPGNTDFHQVCDKSFLEWLVKGVLLNIPNLLAYFVLYLTIINTFYNYQHLIKKKKSNIHVCIL